MFLSFERGKDAAALLKHALHVDCD